LQEGGLLLCVFQAAVLLMMRSARPVCRSLDITKVLIFYSPDSAMFTPGVGSDSV
jgi:hypothetical protein